MKNKQININHIIRIRFDDDDDDTYWHILTDAKKSEVTNNDT